MISVEHETNADVPLVPEDLSSLTDRECAILLARLISELSERTTFAGWHIDCEHWAWRWSEPGDEPISFGASEIDPEDRHALQRLRARLAGGWVAWAGEGEDAGIHWLSAEEWTKRQGRP